MGVGVGVVAAGSLSLLSDFSRQNVVSEMKSAGANREEGFIRAGK